MSNIVDNKEAITDVFASKGTALRKQREAPAIIRINKEGWVAGNGQDPVLIDKFAREYMGRYPSPLQMEMLWDLCGHERYEFQQGIDEVWAMIGQKGGKNWTFEIYISYLLYKLKLLEVPQDYFGVSRTTDIDITNSSMVNARQAKEVFFNRIKNALRGTVDPVGGRNWFEVYADFDLRTDGVGSMKTYKIEFPAPIGHGKIQLHSFDSSPSSPEGLTIFRAIIDEPSRANTKLLYGKAKALYKMLKGNITGSFPKFGQLIAFSYPEQDVNDLTVERYEEIKEAERRGKPLRAKAYKYTRYEFNPTVEEADDAEAYEADPIDANCRFKCIVKKNKFGFFQPYMEKIEEAEDKSLEMPMIVTPTMYEYTIRGETKKFIGLDLTEIKGDNRIRTWGVDPGKSKDSFIIAGCYAERLEKPVTMKYTPKNITGEVEEVEKLEIYNRPIVDIILEFRPEPGKPVDFFNIGEIIQTLIKKFPGTRSFSFDHYESAKLAREIEHQGVQVNERFFSQKLTVRLFTIWRYLVWNNLISMIPNPILYDEMNKLLLINGKKIDHPEGGSKDHCDAVAQAVADIISLAHRGELNPDFGQDFDKVMSDLDLFVRKEQSKTLRPVDPELVAKAFNVDVETAGEMILSLDEFRIATMNEGLHHVEPEEQIGKGKGDFINQDDFINQEEIF